jgi:hypothetical protein
MIDESPSFEQADLEGATTHFNGTVGTSAIAVPASTSGTAIAEALVRCPLSNLKSNRLSISFDGGNGFLILSPGEYVGWSVKGLQKQLFVKGNVSGVGYEAILNREPVP